MLKKFILSALLLLAFSSFNNEAYGQSTTSITINYTGFQACGGCTVCGDDYWCFNSYGSWCGNTTACGTQAFTDPVPPGNIVTDITATFFSAGCGSGNMTATINNNSAIPVVNDGNTGCPCSSNPCTSAGSSTQTFPCGIQDYIYGGSNSFELCTGASVCVNAIKLVFTYVPEDQATPATQPSNITGPQVACKDESTTYSIPAVANAADYTWSFPPGWTIASGQGTTSITATAGDAGDVCVIANNLCGSSVETCLAVTVNSVDPSWTVPSALCPSDSPIDLNDQITGLAGGDFSGDGVSGNSFDPSSAGNGSHTITYTVTGDGCSDSEDKDIEVSNPPVFTLSHTDPTSCANSDGTITISGLDPNEDYSISYDYGGNTVGPTDFTTNANGEVDFTGLDAGDYNNFAVAKSSTSCSGIETTIITLIESGSPSIDGGADQIVCEGEDVTLEAVNSGGATITWDNNVDDGVAFTPSAGTQTYIVTANIGGCISTDQVDVTVNGLPSVDAGEDQVVCEGEDVTLNGSGADTYAWDKSVTNGTPFTPSIDSIFTVTGTDVNGCKNTDQVKLTILPTIVPSFTGDELIGCNPHTVNFTNDTDASGADCVWDFGDGNTGSGCTSVSHTYSNSGTYDVSLTVETVDGCVGMESKTDYVEIIASAIASFTADPMVLGTTDTEVKFTNQSTNSNSYIWDFGDDSPIETSYDSEHTFPDDGAGSYTVTLVALSSQSNCSDTVAIIIEVEDQVIFYVPNTFTPDEDDFNEVFQPVFTAGYDPQDFVMYIYNRWGELLFETHNAAIGWNGTYGNKIVQDGTYVWKIEFKETASDNRETKHGNVNVIR